MKKAILTGVVLAAIHGSFGQEVFEDFDTYTVGDYMGVVSPHFSTWSGAVGGAEDVQVTDAESISGANSIYFSTSSSSGGPQDVIVPFGGEHNTGTFSYKSKFYIEDNKGAYFNFQGKTAVGELYVLNCMFVNDGRVLMDVGSGGPVIETTFPSETWFTLAVNVNLNTNVWEFFIDGISQGSFSNPNNQVASIDLYPVNNTAGANNLAGYYIDDFYYSYTPYVLPERNAAVTNITDISGLATTEITPTVEVRNLGTSAITSFDLSIAYNGTTVEETVTGVSIASLETFEVPLTDNFMLIGGENDIVATISNVNGTETDDDASDDTKTISLNPLVPALGKVVVAEEATGTWCGWCPRGAVFLERMTEQYPDHFIGIAVHNGDTDPMVYGPYDTGLGTIVSGYPSLAVDRVADIDPSAVEGGFLERIVEAPKATLAIGSDYTEGATSMRVSITADFIDDIADDYRLACVIIENHVTGTTSGYNQANYYAGGGSGEMGGYESLPNPVPAADMVYDHVARVILPSFTGFEGSFPETVSAGESHTVGFTVALDEEWDLDEVHIVGLLIGPDGLVDNGGEISLADAAENGYMGLSETLVENKTTKLFPNPSAGHTQLDLGPVNQENVSVKIYNLEGRLVAGRDYGVLNGQYIVPLDLIDLEKGVYTVLVTKGEQTEVNRLVIQ